MKITKYGNPILRDKAQKLSEAEIKSKKIQQFIAEMKDVIGTKDFGVGLAAPQVDESLAIAIIDIKPTDLRPNVEPFSSVIINPSYEGIGRRKGMWEGCLSSGTGDNTLFAKALRFPKIQASWIDENGVNHREELTGLPAHVFQHETDHLDGILFVDKVRDSKTFMIAGEYRKRILKRKT